MLPRHVTVMISIPFMFAGCDRSEPATAPVRPNILLISVDTLRRDHLGIYGYPRATSVNIDAIAQNGAVFDNAVSTSSWTLPAHASMLTGLYPAFHGLQDDGTKLAPDRPALAEKLRNLGYYTLAVVSHVYVSSEFGLERGFDHFDDSLIQGGATNPIAEQVVDRLLLAVEQAPDGPFCAFVHFFDPHWDYDAPPPFDTRFVDRGYAGTIDGTVKSMTPYFSIRRQMPEGDRQYAIALYDGEIAYLDDQLGRMLKTLRERGKMDNTVVVFTADHGEEFKEHGRLGHGKTLFGEQLRVPLIIAGHPAFGRGTRRRDLVSLVDIAPTLLELAGGEASPDSQGASLVHPDTTGLRTVFGESIRFGNEMRTAQQGRFKVIHYNQGDSRQFYDLIADPGERRPAAQDPTGGSLSKALAEYAANADSGWHMKLISLTDQSLHCRAVIRAEGRIVQPRHHFSGNLQGPSRAKFRIFKLRDDEKTLEFEVDVSALIGEITFETLPPDAPVTFEVHATSDATGTGVFLGAGERIANGRPIALTWRDGRLAGTPENYIRAPTGCYIRAVIGPSANAPKTELSEEAIERLKSLGYIGENDD
ncbi:MAG: sulfatase [Planctomycetota bacterium]|nr:sulfatase [Planctomycetota bacterium]